jgi:glycosyltransferase involved in cell wall biosynthesis
VLAFAPTPFGGLAEYLHRQASELARRGLAVRLLCRRDFVKTASAVPYAQDRKLIGGPKEGGTAARLARAAGLVLNRYILAWHIVRLRPAFVLLEANDELLAPVWFLPHWLLRRWGGVAYLANFHDPVRGPEHGANWPHLLRERLSYAALSGGLIHGPPPPRAHLPARLIVREAPHGLYNGLRESPPAFDLRSRLAIPPGAFVLLAFGHVADRKNLDLVIAALGHAPAVHLIVAGAVISRRDRPFAHYAERASQAGVTDRVHLIEGFVPETEVSAWFAGADAISLTYGRRFVSQSGVLHVAALWDKPLLASGGDGPLPRTVDEYGLGIVVEPDSVPAIAAGLARLVAERPDVSANFARYRASTSWAVNVDRLLEVVEAVKASRSA